MRKKTEDISLISQNPTVLDRQGQSIDFAPDGGDDRLLRVDEAARFLGLSVGGVYHLVSQRRINVVRISSRCIRFSRRALLEWVEELTQKAEHFQKG